MYIITKKAYESDQTNEAFTTTTKKKLQQASRNKVFSIKDNITQFE